MIQDQKKKAIEAVKDHLIIWEIENQQLLANLKGSRDVFGYTIDAQGKTTQEKKRVGVRNMAHSKYHHAGRDYQLEIGNDVIEYWSDTLVLWISRSDLKSALQMALSQLQGEVDQLNKFMEQDF